MDAIDILDKIEIDHIQDTHLLSNAYEVIIVYLPDNDIQETTLEVYLQRT